MHLGQTGHAQGGPFIQGAWLVDTAACCMPLHAPPWKKRYRVKRTQNAPAEPRWAWHRNLCKACGLATCWPGCHDMPCAARHLEPTGCTHGAIAPRKVPFSVCATARLNPGGERGKRGATLLARGKRCHCCGSKAGQVSGAMAEA